MSWNPGMERNDLHFKVGLYDEWFLLEVLKAHLSMEFCEYLEDSLGMMQKKVFVLLVLFCWIESIW